eukprot:218155-Hanusia_phi.AAC.1
MYQGVLPGLPLVRDSSSDSPAPRAPGPGLPLGRSHFSDSSSLSHSAPRDNRRLGMIPGPE